MFEPRGVMDFSQELNVAVIGSSGGIGRAFLDNMISQANVARIYSFARTAVEYDHAKVRHMSIDITDESSIARAVNALDKTVLDVVFVATGLLHFDDGNGGGITPEKTIRDLNLYQMEKVFKANCFGPTMVAKHFLPLLPREHKGVFAVLSARVGSISDNRLGGWYSYRASKAALNMMIKNSAIEMARKYKEACVIGLHPGTVDTALSAPFQGSVSADKLFTPAYSAACLVDIINNIHPSDTGCVYAWDGQKIPF